MKIHSAPSVGLESSLVLSDEFTIYPNPASHTANLKIDNNYSGNVEIVVFSMNGQEIVKNSFKKVTRYYNHKLELNDILPGSYIITVKMGDKHLAKQLLIAE